MTNYAKWYCESCEPQLRRRRYESAKIAESVGELQDVPLSSDELRAVAALGVAGAACKWGNLTAEQTIPWCDLALKNSRQKLLNDKPDMTIPGDAMCVCCGQLADSMFLAWPESPVPSDWSEATGEEVAEMVNLSSRMKSKPFDEDELSEIMSRLIDPMLLEAR